MTLKHLCIFLLAFVAFCGVAAQNEEIPIENDNRFPPDHPADPESEIVEGSGDGTGEEPPPAATAETTAAPLLEEVQPTNNVVLQSAVFNPTTCPDRCVCHYDGGPDNFVVDCSGYDLTEFPSPIDAKATTLNIQNNKLTEIPKEISSLKNLKVLNAENNLLRDLVLGSVSELPELIVLKLSNNRLINYPQDLKNSLSLTKLEELDLGGNDIREDLNPELFSNFKALRQLTLSTTTPEKVKDYCDFLKDSLQSVCTESCTKELQECDALPTIEDEDLIPAVLPNILEHFPETSNSDADNVNTEEPSVNTNAPKELTEESVTESKQQDIASPAIRMSSADVSGQQQPSTAEQSIIKEQEKKQNLENQKVENPDADITVGATTAEGKNYGGGVNKSVIGIVVAAMVVIVAGITIKKNWSSIRGKFSSAPRPVDRAGANANGTTLPEEVPLQDKDKSPV